MSSSCASFRLRLTAAQTGIDPRTHYWYRANRGDYRRLCDDTPWTRQRLPATDYGVCWRCYGMHQDDREHGFRAFSLTHKQKGVFARDSEDTLELDEDMPQPTIMQTFVQFYALDTAGREQFVAKQERRRQQSQKQRAKGKSGGGDYYSPLMKHFNKYHWETDDISQLIHSDPELALASHDMTLSWNQTKLATYKMLQEKYVAMWLASEASYSPVESVEVVIGSNLKIKVDPEIGMQPMEPNNAVPWILKLWFLDDASNPRTIQACIYLLGEGRRVGRWDESAQLGLWDVRNAEFERMGSLDDMRHLMHDAANEYLALRKQYGLP